MRPVAVHFSAEELAARRRRAAAVMAGRGLDGLLMFRQESMFYLSGYDSFGYCFFQCFYLGADGRFFLLTRAPDLRQARHTSVIKDIRVWGDRQDSDPQVQLRDALAGLGCRGKKLGVELDACGLNALHWRRLGAALDGFCALEDASGLVSELRAVKSAAEISYVRRAAELADDALDAAVDLARPGADEGEILAAMQGAVFAGGGDYPGNEFIIGAGEDALLCRYFSGRKKLAARDQLTLEFAGVFRRYHACLMRTILIGEPHREHRRMHQVCAEAMEHCLAALQPGKTVGGVFDAHAEVVDAAGFRAHRMNACGYSLGATYAPSWMDWPMFYHANPALIRPGMVFFLHMILMNSNAGRAMTLGQTALVTEDGHEMLGRRPADLIVRG